MNYFAHGRHDTDNPERLAGTALPDWIGVGDRGCRLRRERLDASDLADGARRHLDDDRWFHGNEAFLRTSAELTALIPCDRAWFWGHVLTEMLLDRCLIRREPKKLDAYYAALDRIDSRQLERRVRPWLNRPTKRLAETIDAFRRHRYLYGYLDDDGMLARLHGLGHRVGLQPTGIGVALAPAGEIVEARVDDLTRASCETC